MKVGFLDSLLSKYVDDNENEHWAKDVAAIFEKD